MKTIKCKVVADKVWYSKESRMLVAGDTVDFPAEVKNHENKLVPFKVGDSFEVVDEAADDVKPAGKSAKAAGKGAGDQLDPLV